MRCRGTSCRKRRHGTSTLLTAFKAADGKGALKNAVAQQIPGVMTVDHDRVLHGVGRIIEPLFRGSDGGIDLPGKG